MQVETFECTETAAEPIEASEEAIALIDELGLAGQQELVRPSEKTGRPTRCPYRKMTNEEMFVYRTLCPDVKRLEEYRESPIPLRVLQVASHAKSLGMFRHLRVWDRKSVTVKDPVLVGCTGDPNYSFIDGDTFILARWGEELETFATLLKRACASARERLIGEAESLAKQCQGLTDAEIIEAGAGKKIEW